LAKIEDAKHKYVNKRYVMAQWHHDLVGYLDEAIAIAEAMLVAPYERAPQTLLQNLIFMLQKIKVSTVDGTLTPPDGRISLGLA
jgi:hypothetical protein